MSSRSSVFTFTFALVLAALPAIAQEVTGTLYGKVTDESGLAVPGATITVTSPQLIKDAEVRVTGERGTYRVPALPPGTYSVKAEVAGFQTVTYADIVLQAGSSIGVDFVLKLSPVEETVTVTGESPLVDVKSAQTMRTVLSEVVENIPIGRRFSDLITTAAGVLDSEYGFAPAQTVHGSSVRDNLFNVDGAGANDTTVGYMSMDVPYDIMEEVQITTGGISAEFGQASGAVFNFITKSGGNDLHGGANLYLENDGLQWDNLTEELVAQGLQKGTKVTKNLEYGFTLGGPILRDRVWFFGNLRWFDRELTRPDFPALDPTVDERHGFVKITSQLAAKTKIHGSYTKVNRDEYPSNANFSTNDAPETWQRGLRDQQIFQLSLNQVFTASTYLEAQLSQTLVDLDSEQANNQPGYFDIVTGLNTGGWTGTAGKTFQRDKRTIKVNLSHFREQGWGGSHSFKLGYYSEFSPFARVRDIASDLHYRLRSGQAYRVRLYNTPRTPRTNVSLSSAYLQDEWTLDRLTLNLGLRLEWTEGWQPEQESGGGRWFPVERFPEQRNQIDWFNAAPRLGLVWDLRGNQQTTLKLSYGRYYNALLNQHVLAANRGQAGYQEFDWLDRNNDFVFQPGEQGTLRSDTRASLDDFDPNLRQPYVDAVHVGVEQQVGTDFVISAAGIYKRERQIMETVNASQPFSAYNALTVTNPLDGQPMTIFALDPAFQSVQRVRILTNPNDPLPLERDYYGLELVFRRRMRDGYQFQGSINLGRSEGNIGNSFGQSSGLASVYDTPNTLINADGPLDLDAPFALKLMTTFKAPYDILLSAFYTGISGFPIKPPEDFPTDIPGTYTVRFTRTDHPAIIVEPNIDVAGDPRGTHRFDFRHKLSLRVEKQVNLGKAKLGLLADLFNLLNISSVTAVQIQRFGHPNFLKPAIIETPRSVRLALRVNF
jgi:hypothetical protein